MQLQDSIRNDIHLPNSILSCIGNTPLIEINGLDANVRIFAKAEFMNPGGSVKDRAALSIISHAIETGQLDRSKTLIDATSGNTGIAYAMITSTLDIPCKICIPSNASKERISTLKAYGADLELTDPLEGTDGAIIRARELYQENPDKYYYADQYNNSSNWKAHYETTAEEIFTQSEGRITHFVSGLGTSGTFTGVTRKLKELNSNIQCIAIQPNNPFHGLEGLKHMETAIKPGIYDEKLADQNLTVSTGEAYEMTKWLAKSHGILVGISSGATLVAVKQIARELDTGYIVTVFPDRGDRYLSENIWR